MKAVRHVAVVLVCLAAAASGMGVQRARGMIKSTAENPIQPFMDMVRPYQHTPWDSAGKKYFVPPSLDPASKPPPQSHSGDLLQHSVWAAIAAARFIKNKDPSYGQMYTSQDKKKLVILAALVHDAGKALSCAFRCQLDSRNQQRCWFDTYSDYNYDGRGDNTHPEFSGDWVMGYKKGNSKCPTEAELQAMAKSGDPKGALAKWIAQNRNRMDASAFFSALHISAPNRALVALAAYMHWELGRINIDTDPVTKKYRLVHDRYVDYVKKLKTYAGKLGKGAEATKENAQFCVTVAAADIVASGLVASNCNGADRSVDSIVGQLCDAACSGTKSCMVNAMYEGVNPWTKFQMDVNGSKIVKNLLPCVEEMTLRKQNDCSKLKFDFPVEKPGMVSGSSHSTSASGTSSSKGVAKSAKPAKKRL